MRRRDLITGGAALASYAALCGASRGAPAGASPPYNPQGQSYIPLVTCCTHGGRINTIGAGYGTSGGKTAFKGRRPFYFPRGPRPTAVRFVWANHYRQALTSAPEVAGNAAIVYRAACMSLSSGYAPVTIAGSAPSVPVPPSNATPGTLDAYTFSDLLTPADFGLLEFPVGRLDFRGAGDYTTSLAPVNGATNRPGGGQSMRYAPANEGALDVYAPSTTVMSYPSGYDSVPVFMPIMMIGYYPNGGSAVFGMGDSITYGQGDFQGIGDVFSPFAQGIGGGGNWFERACFMAGVASFNAGVSGQAGIHYSTNAAYLKQLFALFTSATFELGGNEFYSANQATQAPNGAATTLGVLSQFCSDFKSASPGAKVAVSTVFPRTTANNNQKWTTAADQTPDSGLAAGGLGDQYNSAILANPQAYGADTVIDLGSVCRDSGSPYVWKTPNASRTTLAAAYASGSTSATLTDAFAVHGDLVVMDAGASGVDTNSSIGAIAFSVSGTLVSFSASDAYSNTPSLTWLPAIAHASGAAVAFAGTNDGIHPGPRHNYGIATLAAPPILQMNRRW